ncbi:unnamed protein product [Musa acuminata subsp. malaccensis]|uniref:(wild Malaysian banana) hypothetical protein n=1 Tax=Musa acuminata subsp. malaccensis TaxID=214687 RepID=A0A804IXK0_MUSAM|nr:PREDICTED: GATA transcription factor 5-like [Musa acuminata subsp. malaccensis]CAG1844365.1 unnamed protein product [Musa acuminata subsp. malaccensis]
MFHQTLIPSSVSSSPSSTLSSLFFNPSSASFPVLLGPLQPPSLVPPLVYSSCTQVENEARMEEALKSSLRPESGLSSGQQQQHQHQRQQNKGTLSEEGGWSAERGNLCGEGFSVDDLLNLGDYAENDKEAEVTEVREEVEAKAEVADAEHRGISDSSSPCSSTSALSFQPLPPPPPPPLSDISLPAHDAEELEWVSYIIDDSLSEFPHCPAVGGDHFPSPPQSHKKTEEPPAAAPQVASSLDSAVCGLSTEGMASVKAKRSKRHRPRPAHSPARYMSVPVLFADSLSSPTNTCSSASSSSSTSCLIYDHHPVAGDDQSFLLHEVPPPPLASATKPGPKKRGRKPKPSPTASGSGDRRCSHCGAQKTPQWRAGPLGAKTLCNACGVRFKSGRLLPEYRPACSPTFVSHIHSNSHRKVLEMRRKKEAQLPLSPASAPVASF